MLLQVARHKHAYLKLGAGIPARPLVARLGHCLVP